MSRDFEVQCREALQPLTMDSGVIPVCYVVDVVLATIMHVYSKHPSNAQTRGVLTAVGKVQPAV